MSNIRSGQILYMSCFAVLHIAHTRVFITPEDVSDQVPVINDVISTKANYRVATNPTLVNVTVTM